MSRAFKFGWLPHGDLEEEFHYEDVWAREQTTGPERLVLAPSLDQVDLLLALAGRMVEPFWLLYVLAVPRGEGEPGRYQTTSSLTYSELSEFLARFRTFLEGDSRQSLWVKSESRRSSDLRPAQLDLRLRGTGYLCSGCFRKRPACSCGRFLSRTARTQVQPILRFRCSSSAEQQRVSLLSTTTGR